MAEQKGRSLVERIDWLLLNWDMAADNAEDVFRDVLGHTKKARKPHG